MSPKKLSKKQLLEEQIVENRKFNRTMLISFSILSICLLSILIFITYWCDTKYTYRKFALYKKAIPNKLVCMCDNSLQYHESSIVVKESKAFYICGANCKRHINNHFRKVAYTVDAFSGDILCKANALIGLKERGQPKVVYFKNRQSFKKYYEARK